MVNPFDDPSIKAVITGLVAAVIGMLVWMAKRQTSRIDANTHRITSIEARLVDREELRNVYEKMDELKKEISDTSDVFVVEHATTRELIYSSNKNNKLQNSAILDELRKLNE